MTDQKSTRSKQKNPKKKHRFFLNPYMDCAFTKCPKCDAKTKVRKFPLVIHLEPQGLFLLNKKCKYCPSCDLIIAKKQDIESLMALGLGPEKAEAIGSDYLVIGTLERSDWQAGHQGTLSSKEIVERTFIFKDVWDFEVIPAGWYPS